jgi:hypothetical protein
MHKNAMKCNKTQSKWCINKHGASKIIDRFETYQLAVGVRILLEKGPSRHHISEDQQFQEIPRNSYIIERQK